MASQFNDEEGVHMTDVPDVGDELEAAPALKRQNATAHKGPIEMADSSEEMEIPDLSSYLADYGLDIEEQIQLCRSYASYLSRLLPKRAKIK